jgi:ADP-heptose:LPS heptosyltransferase
MNQKCSQYAFSGLKFIPMVKCDATGKNEDNVVRATQLKPLSEKEEQFEFDARNPTKTSGLIAYILRNPAGFISNPRSAQKLFNESEFAAAHAYFSEQNPSRYVFAVSSALFHNRCQNLNLRLYASDMTEYRQSRFWPFWYASDLSLAEAKMSDTIEDYLLNLWNAPKSTRWTPGMFYQTGSLEVEERCQIGGLFFFKCVLPVRRSVSKKPDTITFAFDSDTQSFYTINARVRYEESEHRFRFVEFIAPKLNPPDVRKFLTKNSSRQWKVLFVLDRHIGDNLSLFSTHLAYLAKLTQFDLTLDASMCPFFQKAPREITNRFFPNNSVKFLEFCPARREDYDLVFDPYDWLAEMFDLKPQNDSSAVSIVSGLEYSRFCLNKERRDILDIHMSFLKRMGIVSHHESIPEFVRYRITPEERGQIRKKTRASLLSDSPKKRTAKIVSLFPYGLCAERRYPVEALQAVIQTLLRDPNIYIVIAGTNYDTPEMALTIRTEWQDIGQSSERRIRMFSDEPLANLINLMLASDVVVSMDSGPLHLARSLRVQPIALYTKKVNDLDALLYFPWLVEDGTADILKPNLDDNHVSPAHLASAIQKRLNFLPLD